MKMIPRNKPQKQKQEEQTVKLTAAKAQRYADLIWHILASSWPLDILVAIYLSGSISSIPNEALAGLAIISFLVSDRLKLRALLMKSLHIQKKHRKKVIWFIAVAFLIPLILELSLRFAPQVLSNPINAVIMAGVILYSAWEIIRQLEKLLPTLHQSTNLRIERINRINLGVVVGSSIIARIVSILGALTPIASIQVGAIITGGALLAMAKPQRADFFTKCPRCLREYSMAIRDFGLCPICAPNLYYGNEQTKGSQ